MEEVAEGYLAELIHRSLVQVSSLRIDGKAKGCRVHDLIRDMILEKNEDFNFCKHISDDGQTSSAGIVRHLLSITTIDDVFRECIDQSHVRSLFCFGNTEISSSVSIEIPTKYKLLKVLDFEDILIKNIPNNLGNFIHLKYLSFNNSDSGVKVPNSIGMLQNLETLVLSNDIEFRKEICKLRKLRHLICTKLSLIHLKDGIGEMTSLQTLHKVDLDMDGAVELIKELGMLKQIRKLGLVNLRKEDGSILSSSINEMQHLETLYVESNEEVIDLHLVSKPTMLRKLMRVGWLTKFPEWMLDLQNLTVLGLVCPYSVNDPLQSLKNLQHLLILYLQLSKYEGLRSHFQDGGFPKLKELEVSDCIKLREIIIDKGSMPPLKRLLLIGAFKLNIPTGIQHLREA